MQIQTVGILSPGHMGGAIAQALLQAVRFCIEPKRFENSSSIRWPQRKNIAISSSSKS